jgi:3-methyladenine DNA glycosylase AlkD
MAKQIRILQQPSISPEAYVELVAAKFLEAGDPEKAEQQRAYLRNQFDCFGLSATTWLGLLKTIFHEHGVFSGNQLKIFVSLCYQQDYREMHYTGQEMMQKRIKEWPRSWISVLEKSITTQSWWDTVDWLAKLTGMHFKTFPDLQVPYAQKWITSDNIWLQRVAIIHQLFYREDTNEELLFDLIRRRADSKEFFVQKACGWALRQHAKVFPERVAWFLSKQLLPKLAIREARKQLDKFRL